MNKKVLFIIMIFFTVMIIHATDVLAVNVQINPNNAFTNNALTVFHIDSNNQLFNITTITSTQTLTFNDNEKIIVAVKGTTYVRDFDYYFLLFSYDISTLKQLAQEYDFYNSTTDTIIINMTTILKLTNYYYNKQFSYETKLFNLTKINSILANNNVQYSHATVDVYKKMNNREFLYIVHTYDYDSSPGYQGADQANYFFLYDLSTDSYKLIYYKHYDLAYYISYDASADSSMTIVFTNNNYHILVFSRKKSYEELNYFVLDTSLNQLSQQSITSTQNKYFVYDLVYYDYITHYLYVAVHDLNTYKFTVDTNHSYVFTDVLKDINSQNVFLFERNSAVNSHLYVSFDKEQYIDFNVQRSVSSPKFDFSVGDSLIIDYEESYNAGISKHDIIFINKPVFLRFVKKDTTTSVFSLNKYDYFDEKVIFDFTTHKITRTKVATTDNFYITPHQVIDNSNNYNYIFANITDSAIRIYYYDQNYNLLATYNSSNSPVQLLKNYYVMITVQYLNQTTNYPFDFVMWAGKVSDLTKELTVFDNTIVLNKETIIKLFASFYNVDEFRVEYLYEPIAFLDNSFYIVDTSFKIIIFTDQNHYKYMIMNDKMLYSYAQSNVWALTSLFFRNDTNSIFIIEIPLGSMSNKQLFMYNFDTDTKNDAQINDDNFDTIKNPLTILDTNGNILITNNTKITYIYNTLTNTVDTYDKNVENKYYNLIYEFSYTQNYGLYHYLFMNQLEFICSQNVDDNLFNIKFDMSQYDILFDYNNNFSLYSYDKYSNYIRYVYATTKLLLIYQKDQKKFYILYDYDFFREHNVSLEVSEYTIQDVVQFNKTPMNVSDFFDFLYNPSQQNSNSNNLDMSINITENFTTTFNNTIFDENFTNFLRQYVSDYDIQMMKSASSADFDTFYSNLFSSSSLFSTILTSILFTVIILFVYLVTRDALVVIYSAVLTNYAFSLFNANTFALKINMFIVVLFIAKMLYDYMRAHED